VLLVIFSLKATLHVVTVLSIINQRLYLLSLLKAPELQSIPLIFHALIMSKVEYALSAVAGLLSEN